MQENEIDNTTNRDDDTDDEMTKAEDELQPNDYSGDDEPFFQMLANYFESELLPMVMLLLFITELFILFFAYGPATLTHLGYLSEIIVYSICFFNSKNPYNWRLIRLLFIIRLWRLQRLFSNPAAVLKQENQNLSKKVKQYKEKIKSLQKEIEILNDEIEKEKFHRKELEQSVNDNMTEIETLREALEIAAHAVVEAEMGGAAPGTETDINIQADGGYEITKKHYNLPMIEDIDYNDEGYYEEQPQPPPPS